MGCGRGCRAPDALRVDGGPGGIRGLVRPPVALVLVAQAPQARRSPAARRRAGQRPHFPARRRMGRRMDPAGPRRARRTRFRRAPGRAAAAVGAGRPGPGRARAVRFLPARAVGRVGQGRGPGPRARGAAHPGVPGGPPGRRGPSDPGRVGKGGGGPTMTETTTGSAVELLHAAMFTPEGRRDPYPLLEQLHGHGEHTFMPDGYVAVWGYRASHELMRSPSYGRVPPDPTLRAVFKHDLTQDQAARLRAADTAELGKWLQLVDPPEHTRLRSLVSRAFTPKRLESYRPLIDRTVARLLDGVVPAEPVDFVSRLGYPLPTQVVGELVGLPIDERGRFALKTGTQSADRDPHATFDDLLGAARARHDLARYILGLIEERRRSL